MSVHLDFYPLEALAYACRRWHYAGRPAAGRQVTIGATEDNIFIGAIGFGRGASSEIGSPFGLRQSEICELTRVALGPHRAPTSQIVALAIRLLRRQSPGLRLIVSYADPEHNHVGILYQSLNFWFIGRTHAESLIRLDGRLHHPRSISSKFRTRRIGWLREHVAADAAHVRTLPKFRYVMPLDAGMRRQLAPRVQPYPKALVVVERDRGVVSARAGRRLGLSPSPVAGTNREEPGATPESVAPPSVEAVHG